ncbi:hypothetical protein IFM89_034016 [Coptis chinensis]|uniref:C2 domain-containing protein n=1 Tax=Coptis chinensis TaxID=261450 RepID=A0A835MGE8_9MAGN|nr:hypothetical protein IFM89_034016 [Coptis chinensis]
MDQMPLDLTVLSAKDLKKVVHISKTKAYVVVKISSDLRTEQKTTPVDHDGRENPTWNCNMEFTIDEGSIIVFQLRCKRSLGDRDIGEVNVPIKNLPHNLGNGKQVVSYPVFTKGESKGELSFSYEFGQKVVQPQTDYPTGNVKEPVGTSSPAPIPQPSKNKRKIGFRAATEIVSTVIGGIGTALILKATGGGGDDDDDDDDDDEN